MRALWKDHGRRDIGLQAFGVIQGLAVDAQDGTIWASDHGPRGGDRISKLTAGANHGWPRITHGLDYDGTVISGQHSDPAFASPQMVWVPSMAPSGLAVYRSTAIPDWNGKLLAGGLASRALHRMRIGRETG